MMVTFVSQSEKNALKKTRRVLDAFANRIGDNVWQTIITQDGLNAVKKLLRKSASKSTAVSCHWIRSRSRSELVWVVGNKDKFSREGLVAVNITEKEVLMDIPSAKPIKGELYANTKLQRLDQHLFAVAYTAQALIQNFFPDNIALSRAVFVAGAFHDTGKIDPEFQGWINKKYGKISDEDTPEDGVHIDTPVKFSFEKHPRHNEISALLYQLINDGKTISAYNKKLVKHGIYWHHAKPFRKEINFDTYGGIYTRLDSNIKGKAWSDVVVKVTKLLGSVSTIDRKYRETEHSFFNKCYTTDPEPEDIHSLEDIGVPKYKQYNQCEQLTGYPKQTQLNAINNIVRSCVITADRWISSFSAFELDEVIHNKSIDDFVNDRLEHEDTLGMHINECLTRFPDSDRTQKQAKISAQLSQNDRVQVLAGAAGCGKTKIALEWANLKKAKKILWVCPRVQVCQGLF